MHSWFFTAAVQIGGSYVLSTPQHILVRLVSTIFRMNLKTMVKPHTRASKNDLLTVSMKQQPPLRESGFCRNCKEIHAWPNKKLYSGHCSEIQFFHIFDCLYFTLPNPLSGQICQTIFPTICSSATQPTERLLESTETSRWSPITKIRDSGT